jgi:hypothetical protein
MPFGGHQAPQAAPAQQPPPVIPPAPKVTDPAVQAAANAQRFATAQAQGRRSTILTTGLGDTSETKLGKKQLLGEGG